MSTFPPFLLHFFLFFPIFAPVIFHSSIIYHPMESLPTMSIGSHLEVLRQMLIRIAVAVLCLSAIIFCFKEETFNLLLAPKEYDFVTFRAIEHIAAWFASLVGQSDSFHFEPYHVNLISTELSAQFMMHVTSAFSLGALLASPYILYELCKFVSPALYEHERRYSGLVTISSYLLFVLGVLMTYFVLFPISFRFLATYQVDASVQNTITIQSYISTFTTLTLSMGLTFQLPVLSWIMAKIGLLNAEFMIRFRKHAFLLILILAAIITPPDIFTLILVAIPLYALYEACIVIVRKNQS